MNTLKKTISLGMLLLISIPILISCSRTSDMESMADDSKSRVDASSIIAASSASRDAVDQPDSSSSGPLAALYEEPPLQDADWAIAVPDFLTEEQQLLYRRAHSLSLHTRLGSDIEYAGSAVDLSEYRTVQVGEYTYFISEGPYQNWDDFRTVMCSVFTEDYWNCFTEDTTLREYNGRLCFLDTSLGVGYFYDKTRSDAFRLESQTDTEIQFTLIGHYTGYWMEHEINTTGEAQHRYTLEFPMRLVLTENGWRFDAFHSALLEEDYPF